MYEGEILMLKRHKKLTKILLCLVIGGVFLLLLGKEILQNDGLVIIGAMLVSLVAPIIVGIVLDLYKKTKEHIKLNEKK